MSSAWSVWYLLPWLYLACRGMSSAWSVWSVWYLLLWLYWACESGCPTHGQRGTYLHDFLWHVWVDVQHVVSVVFTSMISLASGWMSRAWSVWYLPPWFVFLACVSGSPVCGQCGTYLRDFLWHMWVVVQQAVSVVTKHHQHVWGHFGHLLVHTLKQSPS